MEQNKKEAYKPLTHEELVAEAIALIQRSNDEKSMKALQVALEAAMEVK